MNKAEHLDQLYRSLDNGMVSDLSDEDLRLITSHTINKNYLTMVKFEMERRSGRELINEMRASTKMQKWMAIATILMTIATFLIVIVTWLKP
ncbi:MAG: hypothetical protein Q8P05_06115 [Candidatus Diapherotrites archaeon]|nr:hypothetical protein [Candidatus Diapherotrites archaeon]